MKRESLDIDLLLYNEISCDLLTTEENRGFTGITYHKPHHDLTIISFVLLNKRQYYERHVTVLSRNDQKQ